MSSTKEKGSFLLEAALVLGLLLFAGLGAVKMGFVASKKERRFYREFVEERKHLVSAHYK